MNPFQLMSVVRIRDELETVLFQGEEPFDSCDFLLQYNEFVRPGDTLRFTFLRFLRGQWILTELDRVIP